jgi:transcriptional regulator with XRE-family HTH domain
MGSKSPDAVDRFIGARVRMRRILVGMSQEKLGEALGITFQQIQKYEKGTNRISVSRLHQIASVLGAPVGMFYEGAPEAGAGEGGSGLRERGAARYETDFLASPEGVQLMRAFLRISNTRVRRKLIELAVAFADGAKE